MAHVEILNDLPGISGLLKQYTRTAGPLLALAQELLRGESTLTTAERETIASYVSSRNNCTFCTYSHGATAKYFLGDKASVLDEVFKNPEEADITPKMKALLKIAGKVQESGKLVIKDDIERARDAGASNDEIHDTVLIAAAFCMYNRYVDGLGTWAPQDPSDYDQYGEILGTRGYTMDRYK